MANFGEVISRINPMDFVTGYERGIELGRKRQVGEQEALRTQIMQARDVPAAEKAGFFSQQELEAMRARQADLRSALEADISAGLAGSRIREQTMAAQLEGLPGRIAEYRAFGKQREEMLPELLQRQREQFAAGGERLAEERGAVRSRAEAKALMGDVEQALAAAESDPALRDLPYYERVARSEQYARDPRARAAIRRQFDRIAGQELTMAAQGGNTDQMNYWMRRLERPYIVQQETIADEQGRSHDVFTLRRYEDEVDDRGQVTQRAGEIVQMFDVDPTSNRSAARMLAPFLGLSGYGAAERTPARRPAQRTQKPPKESPMVSGEAMMGGAPQQPPAEDLTRFQTQIRRRATAAEAGALPAQEPAPGPEEGPQAATETPNVLESQKRIVGYLQEPAVQQNKALAQVLSEIHNRGVALDPSLEAKVRQAIAATRRPRSIADQLSSFNEALTRASDGRALNNRLARALEGFGQAGSTGIG